MARQDPQFKLRLSVQLKEKIDAAAKGNNRSMNAEILSRLEETFGHPSSTTGDGGAAPSATSTAAEAATTPPATVDAEALASAVGQSISQSLNESLSDSLKKAVDQAVSITVAESMEKGVNDKLSAALTESVTNTITSALSKIQPPAPAPQPKVDAQAINTAAVTRVLEAAADSYTSQRREEVQDVLQSLKQFSFYIKHIMESLDPDGVADLRKKLEEQ